MAMVQVVPTLRAMGTAPVETAPKAMAMAPEAMTESAIMRPNGWPIYNVLINNI